MAEDWIKMRCGLSDEPEVIQMSMMLNIDVDAIVGKLHKLWCWADRVSVDGNAKGVTFLWIDRYVHCENFSDSLQKVGWIEEKTNGIKFPKFDRHMSKSAKNRALNQERNKRFRDAKTVTNPSLEKRREEKSIRDSSKEESCPEPAPQFETDPVDLSPDNPSTSQASPRKTPPVAATPPVLVYPVRGKTKTWGLSRELINQMVSWYPGINVEAECRKALAWCTTNPNGRKTGDGMPKFLNGWLSKACNRPTNTGPPGQTSEAPKSAAYDREASLKLIRDAEIRQQRRAKEIEDEQRKSSATATATDAG